MSRTNITTPVILAPASSIGSRSFDFSRQAVVVPIIEGGTLTTAETVSRCEAALGQGAEWLELRSAPAGATVPADAELGVLLPAVGAWRGMTDAVISVETSRPDVARQVLSAGADVISDPSGLADPGLAAVVASAGAALVVSRPAHDGDADPAAMLHRAANRAMDQGVRPGHIFIDPGHDLRTRAPELADSLRLITAMGFPVAVSASAGAAPADGLEGMLATIAICILQGARLIRVHDAGPAIAAARTTEAILGWRQPVSPRHNLV